MSRRLLPAALIAAWVAVAGAQQEIPDDAIEDEGDTSAAPAAPPERPHPALMVAGAAKALLLDIAPAGDRLVAVGRQGVIVVSDDGRQWRQVPSPVSVMLTRVRFLDTQRGWAVGYDGTILHTADGGLNWTLQHHDPEARAFHDILFTDDDHGIAAGAYGGFYRTGDGGRTWTSEPMPLADLGQHFNRLLRLDATTLFTVGERGLVGRSTDGGATWEMLRTPYAGSLFGALPLGGRKVLVFGMRGRVYVIDDVAAVPVQDPAQYDPYLAETLEDPAQIAALGWRRLDSPVQESFFGATRLPDGGILLVGTNAVAVKGDAGLRMLEQVKLPAAETLVDLMPHEAGLLAVGRRGVQNLGELP